MEAKIKFSPVAGEESGWLATFFEDFTVRFLERGRGPGDLDWRVIGNAELLGSGEDGYERAEARALAREREGGLGVDREKYEQIMTESIEAAARDALSSVIWSFAYPAASGLVHITVDDQMVTTLAFDDLDFYRQFGLHAPEVETLLRGLAGGPLKPQRLSCGFSCHVWDIGHGLVAKVGRDRHVKLPALRSAFELQTLASLRVGDLALTVTRRLDVGDATADEIMGLFLSVLDEGLIFWDSHPANVGRDVDGRLYVIDYGAISDIERMEPSERTFLRWFKTLPGFGLAVKSIIAGGRGVSALRLASRELAGFGDPERVDTFETGSIVWLSGGAAMAVAASPSDSADEMARSLLGEGFAAIPVKHLPISIALYDLRK